MIRRLIKKLLAGITVVGLFLPGSAQAYDLDTHFYEMYMLARWAGINHDVSIALATNNEWIDKSLWTSPMFPSFFYVTHRMRRLYHFPAELRDYSKFVQKVKSKIANPNDSHGGSFFLLGKTYENNLFAKELLLEGMREGNLQLVGAGLHVLMDSFGHAGYAFIFGHATAGHWPDRPWTALARHDRMTAELFKALVAIRELLPNEALDKEFKVKGDFKPNYMKGADELQRQYLRNQAIRGALSYNPFLDPTYRREAFEIIFSTAKVNGLIKPNVSIDQVFDLNAILDTSKDIRYIVNRQIVKTLEKAGHELELIFNIDKLNKSLLAGLPVGRLTLEQIGYERIAKIVTHRLTDGLIPETLDAKENANVFENDTSILRDYEMKLRISKMQEAIHASTGKLVQFEPNTLLTDASKYFNRWKAEEISKSISDIEQKLSTDLERVSPSQRERVKWMWRMFRYGFLDMILKLDYHGKANPNNEIIVHLDEFRKLIDEGYVKQLATAEEIAELRKHYVLAVEKQNYFKEKREEIEKAMADSEQLKKEQQKQLDIRSQEIAKSYHYDKVSNALVVQMKSSQNMCKGLFIK